MNIIPAAYFLGYLTAKLNSKTSIVMSLALALLILIAFEGYNVAIRARSTITPQEALEITHVGSLMPPGSCLIVPEVPLRYWCEYLLDMPTFPHVTDALASEHKPIFMLIEGG